jgi:hypothetical protein
MPEGVNNPATSQQQNGRTAKQAQREPLETRRDNENLGRKKNGGAEGSRTPDLFIANEALYQLSYDPIHQSRTRIP